ncbi:S41 family peptidase [Rickettsia endosymbiont of Halotydeus destructor]|uniref:S41 family peptidase n=1 Tax=Rickettsia endosymbiont of Halotydeus destructor TaxID=2996754 RepID=UPI003BB20CF6
MIYFFILIFLVSCQNNSYKNDDLKFIYNQIHENHPGIFNYNDPSFRKNLELNYSEAQKAISQTADITRHKQIIKTFTCRFNDTHLSVHWFDEINNAPVSKLFQISNFYKNSVWITLPTFNLNEKQQKEFILILDSLKSLRKKDIIIFDLKGNQGGNSDYGSQIINKLFGENYSEYKRNLANKDVYIDWRVSPGNLEYLKNIYHQYKFPFLKKIREGLEQNLAKNEPYYREVLFDRSLANGILLPNPIKVKIIVIIDEKNVSAALDFIDELKIMSSNVILIGKTTKADRLYMEVRTVKLPSNSGIFSFPIKVYRNRVRGDNEPYVPDFEMDAENTSKLEKFIIRAFYL